MCDICDISATCGADFGEAGRDGDHRTTVVALALAAEQPFGDVGGLVAAGAANSNGHFKSSQLSDDTPIFLWVIERSKRNFSGRRDFGREFCTSAGRGRRSPA